jgi:hypothetical protein
MRLGERAGGDPVLKSSGGSMQRESRFFRAQRKHNSQVYFSEASLNDQIDCQSPQ